MGKADGTTASAPPVVDVALRMAQRDAERREARDRIRAKRDAATATKLAEDIAKLQSEEARVFDQRKKLDVARRARLARASSEERAAHHQEVTADEHCRLTVLRRGFQPWRRLVQWRKQMANMLVLRRCLMRWKRHVHEASRWRLVCRVLRAISVFRVVRRGLLKAFVAAWRRSVSRRMHHACVVADRQRHAFVLRTWVAKARRCRLARYDAIQHWETGATDKADAVFVINLRHRVLRTWKQKVAERCDARIRAAVRQRLLLAAARTTA